MKEISISSKNIMSVIMGTGVNQTWRGQPNLVINVPFDEWFTFVKDNSDLLASRSPFNCKEIISNNKSVNWYKVFLWDIIHAQYNEICVSANLGNNATIIIPSYDGDNSVHLLDCVSACNNLSPEDFEKARRMILAQKPEPPGFYCNSISTWNHNLFRYCIYLQHLAFTKKGDEVKIKVDWR